MARHALTRPAPDREEVAAHQLGTAQPAFGERDEHRREREPEHRDDRDGAQDHGPGMRAGDVAQRLEDGDQPDRHLRLDGVQRKVEDDLGRRVPANQPQRHQRAGQATRHQRLRAGEEHAEHQWKLAQRERMNIAPEVDVEPAGLGDAEEGGEHHPRDRHGRGCQGQPADHDQVEQSRNTADQRAQRPDPAHGIQRRDGAALRASRRRRTPQSCAQPGCHGLLSCATNHTSATRPTSVSEPGWPGPRNPGASSKPARSIEPVTSATGG